MRWPRGSPTEDVGPVQPGDRVAIGVISRRSGRGSSGKVVAGGTRVLAAAQRANDERPVHGVKASPDNTGGVRLLAAS